MKRIFIEIRSFLRERFSLAQDQDNENDIVEAIRKGVPFKGINLWLLIFATFIASVGLNVNSTAVVIGAMLISPLMGPIMGMGLGAGINDIQLLSNASKNLLIAVTFSILTSAIYFTFTPLNQAQSELLARTSPTFWDVLIAFFGGLAGVFAGSSKEKGNAIPGVAIATALMPPLCTAGYGLATLNFQFFFGALYLFFINSVLISATTFMVVQFLDFKHAEYMDAKRTKTVKRIIYGLVFFTVMPSLYLGYNIVKKSAFEINVNDFVSQEFNSDSYYILDKKLSYNSNKDNEILLYIGGVMDSVEIHDKELRLKNYGIENAQLHIKQGNQLLDILDKEKSQMDQLTLKHAQELNFKDSIIVQLQSSLDAEKKYFYSTEKVLDELKTFYPEVDKFSIAQGELINETDSVKSLTNLVYISFTDKAKEKDYELIENWLKNRLDTDEVQIVK